MILNSDVEVDILVTKAPENLDEVTIKAQKPIYKLEAGKRVYQTSNDESIQNSFAINALENAPGVFINSEGTTLIRGQEAEIWINGRQTKKGGEQLQEYLRSLPASSIEKIEIITNPSARYSAVNTNSIVNIVLIKKMPEDRLYAAGLGSNLAQNCYQNQAFATAYITKKKFDFNAFVRYGATRNPDSGEDRSYALFDNDTVFEANRNFENIKETKNNIKVSTDMTYRFNDKTSLSGNINYNYNELAESNTTHQIRNFDSPFDLSTDIRSTSVIHDLSGEMVFEHNFEKEGHTLSFDMQFGDYINTGDYSESRNLNTDNYISQRFSKPYEKNQYFAANVHYNLPLNENSGFQFGIESAPYSYSKFKKRMDTVSSQVNISDENVTLSQENTVDMPAIAAFALFNGTLFKIMYEIGLRYENNSYYLDQTTPETKLDKNYQNIYPSASFSYETSGRHSFSLAYSRRAVQPFFNLNPYIDRTSEDYIFSGNPGLKEALTNSFDFTYFKELKKMNITASLYRRYTKNDVSEISQNYYDAYFQREVVLHSYENCADNIFTGSELSISSSPLKGLRINFSSDVYYKQLNSIYNDVTYNSESFEISSKMKISYKFFKTLIFTLNPVYTSDNTGLFGNAKGEYYVNAELTFDLWNKRLSFWVKQRDIFGTRRQVNEYSYENLYQYSALYRPYQMSQFAVVYRFGNPKFDRKAKVNIF